MSIFFQQDIDERTRLAVWKIEEDEDFFLQHVPLQREITHPHKRLQHLAGRYLLQYLFPDFPISLIKVADTRKPYLENEAYHFSISHCGDFAAAIVSEKSRVGVDIELPTHKVEKIKRKFLHAEELAVLEKQWSGDAKQQQNQQVFQNGSNILFNTTEPQLYHLTLLWSAKEAVYKWWSYGSVDFSDMIRLYEFPLSEKGSFEGQFRSARQDWPLVIHYRLFQHLCLAWIAI